MGGPSLSFLEEEGSNAGLGRPSVGSFVVSEATRGKKEGGGGSDARAADEGPRVGIFPPWIPCQLRCMSGSVGAYAGVTFAR